MKVVEQRRPSTEIDVLVDPKRSAIMRSVGDKNTAPELKVRSALHKAGYRFRLHRKDLPGSPDIVLPSRKAVVFVHGCFWHRHAGCRYSSNPSTRADFWRLKFARNVERDRRNIGDLEKAGWSVHVVWECETKGRDPTFWDSLERFLSALARKTAG
ncbi:very short patch repair endonuclease [Brevundimonas sp. G8]|uniref:very short patch repair endonuclease n=1 Tax=Brevundimonas sp. G8 TaxID=1350776 RepID=UPI001358EEA5|nr:DNA mismatch endonuclease Vsr [Brevundimonas sp. G8]